MESIGILAALIVIIIMINRKNSLSLSMGSGALIILVASGTAPPEAVSVIFQAITAPETVDLVLIVGIITALAGLMHRNNFFEKMVEALRNLLGNDRLTLMLIPGLVGSMPMAGGAIVSAPIVDHLGGQLNLSTSRRSAANNIFRHSWYFIFPLWPTFVLSTRLGGISVQELIMVQWPLTVAMLLAGYYFVMAPIKGSVGKTAETRVRKKTGKTKIAEARTFTKYCSPILVSLLLHLAFGIHLALSLIFGMGLALLLEVLGERRASFRWSRVPMQILRDVNYDVTGAMLAIMVFRAAIEQTDTFELLMLGMLDLGVPLYVIAAGLAAVMGFVTGQHTGTLAIVLPVMVPMATAAGEPVAVYVMVAYCFAFLTYLISPLHLCQILTNDYFDVAVLQVYRIYVPVLLAVAATAVIVVLLSGVS